MDADFFCDFRNFDKMVGLHLISWKPVQASKKPNYQVMKTNTLIVVAALIGLAGVANSEERKPSHDRGNGADGKGRPDRPFHPIRPLPPEVLEKFDTNKDGKLDEAEREAFKKVRMEKEEEMRKKMLEKFDKDGNGELNESEKEEMRKAMKKIREEQRDKRGGPEGPRDDRPEGGDKKEAPGVLGE